MNNGIGSCVGEQELTELGRLYNHQDVSVTPYNSNTGDTADKF